ncbi:uncharacterized protein LOC131306834 [Rhododendron vialii]|uniref:uncharacterized protein LOC131306834 n=1 Tax=Rhododendron vialii TaxID=182163 RepID=UPI00265F1081|nr:uncharacterized protein LOC131306834 [Rhododendron vialii]
MGCPKRRADTDVAQHPLQPISFCNVAYKVLTKVLANRLSEVIHHLKSKKRGCRYGMVVKLDMSKAYDSVEWHFIEVVMRRMGFSEIWIGWILECISSVSFSVLINGEKHGYIVPSRGLRQDDTLIFSKATDGETDSIQVIPRDYGLTSGQVINFDKSAIFFSTNTPGDIRQQICHKLGVRRDAALGNYVRLPTDIGRSKKAVFAYVKDALVSRIEGWSESIGT